MGGVGESGIVNRNTVPPLDPGSAQIDYDCAPPNSNSAGYAAAILVHGFYTGPAGPINLAGQDALEQPATTFNVFTTESRVNSCITADLALGKSDGGISVRAGQTIRVGELRGEIVRIDGAATTLRSGGDTIRIPNSMLVERIVIVEGAEPADV